MPETTQANEKPNLQFPVTFEQYTCPNDVCEASIPQQYVFNTYPDPSPATGQQRLVRVYCPHCQRIYQRRFVLRGGQWQPLGDVELVTDARTVKGILRRVDHLNGVTLAQSA